MERKDRLEESYSAVSIAKIPSLKRTHSGENPSGNDFNPLISPKNRKINNMPSIPQIPSNTSTTGSTTTPPTIMRAATTASSLNRPNTSSLGRSNGASKPQATKRDDWRTYLTIEERQTVRSKIEDAYTKTCHSYEELIQMVSAIEEELLHISAPSRLDYFKSGFEYESRVNIKKDQLKSKKVSSNDASIKLLAGVADSAKGGYARKT